MTEIPLKRTNSRSRDGDEEGGGGGELKGGREAILRKTNSINDGVGRTVSFFPSDDWKREKGSRRKRTTGSWRKTFRRQISDIKKKGEEDSEEAKENDGMSSMEDNDKVKKHIFKL